MMAGDVSGEVRRWKLVAFASALVAVAAVAGLIGWVARGSGDANVATNATFAGGGQSICHETSDTRFRIGTVVKILGANGNDLANGKIVTEPVYTNGVCRQEFLVDGIPGGRGIYLVKIGRWQHPVSEDQLRTNMAEFSLN
ncbi:hypothetical protein [Catellatospora tritici]|uniref:hypothetical protein n=1 Tax=Catellatospora tritici TaxID=2851566 RepID=UPI001C2D4FE3|nr:hypothetical protein [Catellatospora tritici]MBV1851785.1 hypothetical protein [Catellatospora tritici]